MSAKRVQKPSRVTPKRVGTIKNIARAGETDSKRYVGAISVHYPNDNLVSAIIRAWTDESFRRRLLTYPDIDHPEEWGRKREPAAEDYERTSKALAEMGVPVSTPVVLTHKQYKLGFIAPDCDAIFVLPGTPSPGGGRYSVTAAKTAMAFCVFGM